MRMLNLSKFFAAFGLTLSIFMGQVMAADLREEYDITCKITDVEALVNLGERSVRGGAEKARSKLADWMFGDTHSITLLPVVLMWRIDKNNRSRLSLLLDGQTEKSATILSRTNDTIAAVHMASDRSTTRSWLFSLNFKQEIVMATMNESNSTGARGMVTQLDCDYELRALPSGSQDNAG